METREFNYKIIIGSIVVLLMLFLVSCRENNEKTTVLARVNDFEITEERFKARLANLCYLQGIGSLSLEDRNCFLQQEIERHLLIDEAMRRGLDREEPFRASIQNFWEQTLITNLLRVKNDEFKKKVIVTQEEVKRRFDDLNAEKGRRLSFEEEKAAIEKTLLREKQEQELYNWIENLRDNSKIEMYEAAVGALR
ncbi:MAG: hypothetical protein V1816_19165 [Pseudomonadota bacterium]